MIITQDTILQEGVHFVPEGISIEADGVTLDGNGALLVGLERAGRGVSVVNRQGVKIKNLRLQEFHHGIFCSGCRELTITACQVASTAEVAANTIFLDIWLPVEQAYGGGILLANSQDSLVTNNDLQHQMAGLLAYGCSRLTIRENNACYCSGWGFHLYESRESLYEDNCADYCCRWEPRGGRKGHMDNSLIHNNKAIRIAANQDHGIRPYRVPAGQEPAQWLRPHDHIIRNNTIQENRLGVEAIWTDQTLIEGNTFTANSQSESIL